MEGSVTESSESEISPELSIRENEEESGETLREKIEREFLKYLIPKYIINLLDITGYLTSIALKGFQESDLNYIEACARNDVFIVLSEE